MRLLRTYAASAVTTLVAVLLSGCPSPVLEVSPGAISFTADQNVRTLSIRNAGAGSLSWTVSENLPWLSVQALAKQADISGTTEASQTDAVDLLIDRNQLPFGVTNGVLTVASNAGSAEVAVSVTKTGPALLEVTASTLDFGANALTQTFTIRNNGLEALDWNLTKSGNSNWLTISPLQGTLATQGNTQAVTVSVNRDALPPDNYAATLSIQSNGGNANVAVSMLVTPISISPSGLSFGTLLAPSAQELRVSNEGNDTEALSWTATTTSGGNWLSLDSNGATLAEDAQTIITATANPSGLAAGTYNGTIAITGAGGAYTVNVPVSMSVATLTVAPKNFPFGTITTAQTGTFVATNIGAAAVSYSVSIPASQQSWLSVTPAPASLAGNSNFTHTITANPLAVEPGIYSGTITVTYPNGVETVTVSMTVPRPARLVVVSQDVNFGTTGAETSVDIWNDGPGLMNWSIDTSAFPAWLTLAEAVGGTASGSVQGPDETDSVTLRVNRALAPANVFDLSHVFNVVASGAATGTAAVSVVATVPRVPRIEIEADAVDNNGVPFINVDIEATTRTFIIRNVGNGVLNWGFRATEIPVWISSITPLQGGLEPGAEQVVSVLVDRTTLSYLGAQVSLNLDVNDPTIEGGVMNFIVEVQVPKRVAITGRPSSLAFGSDESVALIEIANSGDPGTQLLYRIRSTKDTWLKVFDTTGSSLGLAGTDKDFQAHFVSIVRSELEGNGTSGKLIVEAIRVNQDGQAEVLPEVAPFEITVSVEAAELTFQNALPRLRVPSLARFVLLMRNLQYSPIDIPDTRLDILANQVNIFENSVELEDNETQKIAKGSNFIRGNLLLLLDYSNSMQLAARAVADPAISGAADPIQALYERCITQLIQELPSNYRIGIAIFSERSGGSGGSTTDPRDALRPIYGTVTEDASTIDELFLDDRALLINRLNNVFVATNGATELYPAMLSASNLLWEEDNIVGIVPFDDADDRIILAVTDGRATTPPGQITDITDQLTFNDHTRAFVLGWGQNVSTGPLVLLTTATGGHVYATQNSTSNIGGITQEIPIVEEMENYCVTNDADPCDDSVSKDLESQFVFSYVTLNEASNVVIEGRLTFDDPNDQASTCLPEQGEISGKFVGDQTPLSTVAGDPRLGQIKLRYDGLQPDNSGLVTIYLDSAPRDIRQFSLRLETIGANPITPAALEVTTRTDGGLISTWTRTNVGNVYTFTSPDGTPLRFGDYGPLAVLNVTGINSDASRLAFQVVDPVYDANDENVKYFTAPNTLYLAQGPFVAPSFPRALITLATINGLPVADPDAFLSFTSEGDLVFDLGETVNEFELAFNNLGGYHDPTGVGLRYSIIPNAGSIVIPPDPLPLGWSNPEVYSTLEPEFRRFRVNRSTPGVIDGTNPFTPLQIDFDYLLRGLGYEGSMRPLLLQIEVTAGQVNVTPDDVVFNSGDTEETLVVSNTGQGDLTWSLDPNDDFPSWLSASAPSGALSVGETDQFTLTADRTGLPPGNQSFTFTVFGSTSANTTSEEITVTLVVP